MFLVVKIPLVSPVKADLMFCQPALRLESWAAPLTAFQPPDKPPCIAPPANAPIPPNAAPARPALNASLRLPPSIRELIPPPIAPPIIGPNVAVAIIGITIFATFLTTSLTLFHASLSQPNSIRPVSGLMLLLCEPTTYCSGSSIPLSRRF